MVRLRATQALWRHFIVCRPVLSSYVDRIQSFSTKNRPAAAKEGRIISKERLKSGQQGRICRGCGVQLHARDSSQLKAESQSHRKASKRLGFLDITQTSDAFLCQRCRSLNENKILNAYDALQDLDPAVFGKQLSYITNRRQFGLCLLVVDATDPEHTCVKDLRRWIPRRMPVFVILNKIDLLPRLTSSDVRYLEYRIRQVVQIKTIGLAPVSATTGAGLVDAAEQILGELGGRDVFCVGSANVGKSSFVQAFAELLTEHGILKGKSARRRRRPTIVDGPQTPQARSLGLAFVIWSLEVTHVGIWRELPRLFESSAGRKDSSPSKDRTPLRRLDELSFPKRSFRAIILFLSMKNFSSNTLTGIQPVRWSVTTTIRIASTLWPS